MMLSKFAIVSVFVFCAGLVAGCGSPPAKNTAANANVANQPTNKPPFSTKEPEVYQGEFVMGMPDGQKKYFIAKKGGNWRIDFFDDNKKDWSQLRSDKLYFIDHKRKVYAAEPSDVGTTVESPYFTSILSGFFKGTEYRQYDDLGRDGNLKKYRVKDPQRSQDEIVLYVDEATGMVVKQEYGAYNEMDGQKSTAKYTYEIKNLNLNVDDSEFQIPDGYKEISWQQYSPNNPSKQ
jgi:hypothetical protein